jgi:hypothetical protein
VLRIVFATLGGMAELVGLLIGVIAFVARR